MDNKSNKHNLNGTPAYPDYQKALSGLGVNWIGISDEVCEIIASLGRSEERKKLTGILNEFGITKIEVCQLNAVLLLAKSIHGLENNQCVARLIFLNIDGIDVENAKLILERIKKEFPLDDEVK